MLAEADDLWCKEMIGSNKLQLGKIIGICGTHSERNWNRNWNLKDPNDTILAGACKVNKFVNK